MARVAASSDGYTAGSTAGCEGGSGGSSHSAVGGFPTAQALSTSAVVQNGDGVGDAVAAGTLGGVSGSHVAVRPRPASGDASLRPSLSIGRQRHDSPGAHAVHGSAGGTEHHHAALGACI
eukprot:360538-Chlamydomonas_euryale.AAC.8